jgi:hypothetical protein
MPTCANCSSDAYYVYQITPSFVINYCSSHLPRSLYAQRDGGNVLVIPPVEETPAPTPSKKASKDATS